MHFDGTFKASLIPLVGALSGTISILGCYWIAQYYGHEKPFPHSTISATADHYPEYILFRVGTISGAVFLALAYFINYFWMLQVGKDNTFDVKKYRPQVGLVMGLMGSFALMGSTANLNTGKHNYHWHVACAGTFFLFSIFANLYNTFVILMLYSNHLKGISWPSTFLKIILSILTIIQMVIDLNHKNQINQQNQDSRIGKDDLVGNFLEYSLAFSILAYIFIMAYDVRRFKMVYIKYK